jgi:hypothetical protein
MGDFKRSARRSKFYGLARDVIKRSTARALLAASRDPDELTPALQDRTHCALARMLFSKSPGDASQLPADLIDREAATAWAFSLSASHDG